VFRDITPEELRKTLADISSRSFGLDADRSVLDKG
jgi:hypothetical protein